MQSKRSRCGDVVWRNQRVKRAKEQPSILELAAREEAEEADEECQDEGQYPVA